MFSSRVKDLQVDSPILSSRCLDSLSSWFSWLDWVFSSFLLQPRVQRVKAIRGQRHNGVLQSFSHETSIVYRVAASFAVVSRWKPIGGDRIRESVLRISVKYIGKIFLGYYSITFDETEMVRIPV